MNKSKLGSLVIIVFLGVVMQTDLSAADRSPNPVMDHRKARFKKVPDNCEQFDQLVLEYKNFLQEEVLRPISKCSQRIMDESIVDRASLNTALEMIHNEFDELEERNRQLAFELDLSLRAFLDLKKEDEEPFEDYDKYDKKAQENDLIAFRDIFFNAHINLNKRASIIGKVIEKTLEESQENILPMNDLGIFNKKMEGVKSLINNIFDEAKVALKSKASRLYDKSFSKSSQVSLDDKVFALKEEIQLFVCDVESDIFSQVDLLKLNGDSIVLMKGFVEELKVLMTYVENKAGEFRAFALEQCTNIDQVRVKLESEMRRKESSTAKTTVKSTQLRPQPETKDALTKDSLARNSKQSVKSSKKLSSAKFLGASLQDTCPGCSYVSRGDVTRLQEVVKKLKEDLAPLEVISFTQKATYSSKEDEFNDFITRCVNVKFGPIYDILTKTMGKYLVRATSDQKWLYWSLGGAKLYLSSIVESHCQVIQQTRKELLSLIEFLLIKYESLFKEYNGFLTKSEILLHCEGVNSQSVKKHIDLIRKQLHDCTSIIVDLSGERSLVAASSQVLARADLADDNVHGFDTDDDDVEQEGTFDDDELSEGLKKVSLNKRN